MCELECVDLAKLLEVKNLTTAFKTDNGYAKAVNDISFDVEKGSIVGLVGESGSGKSVSSYSIMGLLPKHNSRIESGEILFEGKDLLKCSPKEMAKIRGKDISMIFQEPMTSLNPVYTVESQIAEVFYNHTGLRKSEIKAKILELLNRVGMQRAEEVMKVYPHQLSGGMRQRVMIALAIALKPKILIADEPTTALDVTIQAQILQLIKKLSIEDQMSVIFISHNLGVISNICEKVIVMYSSQIVEMTDTRTLYYQPKHPYTKSLISCIPQIGMSGQKLNQIEGTVPHPNDKIEGCRFKARCSYAMDICENEPEMRVSSDNDGHFYRCFREDA